MWVEGADALGGSVLGALGAALPLGRAPTRLGGAMHTKRSQGTGVYSNDNGKCEGLGCACDREVCTVQMFTTFAPHSLRTLSLI